MEQEDSELSGAFPKRGTNLLTLYDPRPALVKIIGGYVCVWLVSPGLVAKGLKAEVPKQNCKTFIPLFDNVPLGDASNPQRPLQTVIPDGQGVGPPNTSTRNEIAGRRVYRGVRF